MTGLIGSTSSLVHGLLGNLLSLLPEENFSEDETRTLPQAKTTFRVSGASWYVQPRSEDVFLLQQRRLINTSGLVLSASP